MATRSTIQVRTSETSALRVYCHWDGYPSGVGALLLEEHNDPVRARALVEGGDISSIEAGSVNYYAKRSTWDKLNSSKTRQDEPWDHVRPKEVQGSEILEVPEEYAYDWRGDAWWIRHYQDDEWRVLTPKECEIDMLEEVDPGNGRLILSSLVTELPECLLPEAVAMIRGLMLESNPEDR